MAQSEGFKHITVTAAEEEDVVIVAGSSAEEPDVAAGSRSLGVSGKDGPGATSASAGRDDAGPQPGSRSSEPARWKASKPAKPKRRPYRETSLEDLEREPMPLAQRVVVIAAIVCIIGAVIYYLAFMR